MKYRNIILIASVFGALAVGFGAFGAHGLKNLLPIDKLAIFKTGVTYHLYHSLALLCVGILARSNSSKWLKWSSFCFIAGIIFFSGSLYLLATREIIGLVSYIWLGPITPIGGLLFMMGWLALGGSVLNINDKKAAL